MWLGIGREVWTRSQNPGGHTVGLTVILSAIGSPWWVLSLVKGSNL